MSRKIPNQAVDPYEFVNTDDDNENEKFILQRAKSKMKIPIARIEPKPTEEELKRGFCRRKVQNQFVYICILCLKCYIGKWNWIQHSRLSRLCTLLSIFSTFKIRI